GARSGLPQAGPRRGRNGRKVYRARRRRMRDGALGTAFPERTVARGHARCARGGFVASLVRKDRSEWPRCRLLRLSEIDWGGGRGMDVAAPRRRGTARG